MSALKKVLTKKRIVTICITIGLLGLVPILHELSIHNIIYPYPVFARIMLVSTAVAVFGGCVMQTVGFKRLSLALEIVVFFILCTCLFYSVDFTDFAVFFICMALIIKRTSSLCDCMEDCDNSLR